MIETFDCPACGGPLEYKGGNDKTVRCPFCLNSVIVPKELRTHTANLLHINIHPSHGLPKALPVIILVSVGLIILGIVLAVILSRAKPTPPQVVVNVPQPPQIRSTPAPPPPKPEQPPGFAT